MKNLKIILSALFVSLLATSCLVDDEADNSFENSPAVVGFKSGVAAESYFEDIGAIERTFPVDLLGNGGNGELPNEDIVVSYEIDDASTATEGLEFNFVDNSGTLTIPAGSTFANFPLEINTGSLDPDAPTRLILNLTGTSNDNSTISQQNDQLAITFVGCQSQLDQFTYNVTTTRVSDGALMAVAEETIVMESVNVFSTESTGPYGPNTTEYASSQNPIAPESGYTFTDICGEITIEDQGLAMNTYSNQVYGSGEVDPETGNFTVTYTVTFASGNQTYVSEFVQQ